MHMFSRIASIFVLLVLFVACKPQKPSDVMTPDQMESFLYDYHIAKAIGDDEEYSKRYTRDYYIDYVYAKHNITKEQFDHSLRWYTRHIDDITKIYENVSTRLTTQKEEIDQLVAWQYDVPLTTTPGDSVDVWAWHRIYRLDGTPLNNKVTFTLPIDSNFYEKDKIEWNVHFHLNEEQLADSLTFGVMQLGLQFDNDSLLLQTQTIEASGMKQIVLQSDSLGPIKNIKGFIYLPPQKQSSRLLIDSISMMRYHEPKDTIAIDEFTGEAILSTDSTQVEALKLETNTKE